MLNVKLAFPKDYGLKLYIGKGKKGFYGTLYYQSKDGSRKTDINTFNESDFEIDIKPYENSTLDVTINEKLISLDDNPIIRCSNVFKKGTLLNLINLDNKGRKGFAGITVDLLPLVMVKHEELPDNLFARRNSYRVSVVDDNHVMIVRYANLHQHTEYSLLDGICKIPDLAKKTEHACAITDHGNMSGILEFYSKMKSEGKKPIIGVEAYVESVDKFVVVYDKLRKGVVTKSQAFNLGLEGGDPVDDGFVEFEIDSVFERMFDDENEVEDLLNGDHLILLAKTEKGMKNLFKLSTMAETNKRLGKPHVKLEWLKEYSEDIIATSACIAGTLGKSIKYRIAAENVDEFIRESIKAYGHEFYNKVDIPAEKAAIVNAYKANHEVGRKYIEAMIDIFGKDDFYIEIQDHHFDLETEIMKEVKKYAKEYGLKMTIGIDAHYMEKDDAYVHELWLCQQTKKTFNDPRRMRFSGDGYFVHTSDEVVDLFKEDPDMAEALDNTLEIADKCNVVIDHKGYKLPGYPIPEGYENDKEYFLSLCRQKYKEKFQGTEKYRNQEYLDRMKFEIDTIIKMGFWTYFLIVQDYIAWARDPHVKDNMETYFPKSKYNWDEIPEDLIKDYVILVGPGRGSGAGSLVCNCLGITDVDPIEYGLLFERFLNPDRISMPK